MNPEIFTNTGKTKNNKLKKWVTICPLEFSATYQRTIGLSENGIWVQKDNRDINNDIYLIETRNDCYYLLTVLEFDRLKIENWLMNGLETAGLPIELINTFPFKELIKYTLTSGTPYWQGLAIKWLRQEDFDNEFRNISISIIERKELDQKSRHQLFRMKKRYEKSTD